MDQAIRIKKLASILGCSVPSVRRLIHKDVLPKGTTLPGSRIVIWFESDISKVLDNLKKEPKQPSLPMRKTWRSKIQDRK